MKRALQSFLAVLLLSFVVVTAIANRKGECSFENQCTKACLVDASEEERSSCEDWQAWYVYTTSQGLKEAKAEGYFRWHSEFTAKVRRARAAIQYFDINGDWPPGFDLSDLEALQEVTGANP